jgi:hypothetical protein
VRVRTAKARLKEVRITKSKFADDAAVFATMRQVMEEAAEEFVRTADDWGLTVSLGKTKLLTMGSQTEHEDVLPVQQDSGEIATVKDFSYLGSNITRDGEVRNEVAVSLGKTFRAFGCLQCAVYQNHRLSVKIKRESYRAHFAVWG